MYLLDCLQPSDNDLSSGFGCRCGDGLKSHPHANIMAKNSSSSSSPPAALSAAADRAVPPLPATYEAALKELETLVSGLDAGQLPLEELLGAYQRGAQLLDYCKSKLETVEGQIKVLEGAELKPWKPD